MKLSRKISIAPMMDCTDRHFRYFMRLLSQYTLLYSEMVTAQAVIHGDRDRLLGFSVEEGPVALQLGGSDPKILAEAARIGAQYGYAEINLNVGCPSDRVQAGRIGVCLMKEPKLVAECLSAMQKAVTLPVTLKTRLGVDELDSYEYLSIFLQYIKDVGCNSVTLHARKAWLKGLSPRDNRNIPPLNYDRVYQIKRDFPELEIIINGGIKTIDEVSHHLNYVDGVMIGREAYSNPYLFADVDQLFFDAVKPPLSQESLVLSYLDYIQQQHALGVPMRNLTRFLVGLFKGQPGSRLWRRHLSEHGAKVDVVKEALSFVVQP